MKKNICILLVGLFVWGCGSSANRSDTNTTPVDTSKAPLPDIEQSTKRPPTIPAI